MAPGEPGAAPTGEDSAAVVTLTIPCAPEYVGTARLTILGVASRMGFSYDQIEDIRLAVGEACTNAIDRAALNHGGAPSATTITIRSFVDPSRLIVEVEDRAGVGSGEAAGETSAAEVSGMDPQELGALLMEILVDEVTVEPSEEGTRVRLVKLAAEA